MDPFSMIFLGWLVMVNYMLTFIFFPSFLLYKYFKKHIDKPIFKILHILALLAWWAFWVLLIAALPRKGQ